MNIFKNLLFKLFRAISAILVKTPIKRMPGIKAVHSFIFKRLWGSEKTIEIEGSKMYINLNDPNPAIRATFQAYSSNLIHEKATTELLERIIKKGDVVVDLGANIGYFTLLAAKLTGETGKVFAFEPEPTNFKYLVKNAEINNYKQVQAFQKAASDKNGETELFICDYDSGHHTINRYDGIQSYRRGRTARKHSVKIETVVLDEFLKSKTDRVDVIKMDIEGSEALALAGMKKILASNKNIKMITEFFPLLIKSMGSSPETYAKKLINDFGFNVFAIGHDYNLDKSEEDFIEIKSYKNLANLMKNKEDHINLFLTRESLR